MSFISRLVGCRRIGTVDCRLGHEVGPTPVGRFDSQFLTIVAGRVRVDGGSGFGGSLDLGSTGRRVSDSVIRS